MRYVISPTLFHQRFSLSLLISLPPLSLSLSSFVLCRTMCHWHRHYHCLRLSLYKWLEFSIVLLLFLVHSLCYVSPRHSFVMEHKSKANKIHKQKAKSSVNVTLSSAPKFRRRKEKKQPKYSWQSEVD